MLAASLGGVLGNRWADNPPGSSVVRGLVALPQILVEQIGDEVFLWSALILFFLISVAALIRARQSHDEDS